MRHARLRAVLGACTSPRMAVKSGRWKQSSVIYFYAFNFPRVLMKRKGSCEVFATYSPPAPNSAEKVGEPAKPATSVPPAVGVRHIGSLNKLSCKFS